MRRVPILLASFLALQVSYCAVPTLAQKPLAMRPAPEPPANDDGRVVEMMDLGLDDDIIVAKIRASDWTFVLTNQDLLRLRQLGLSAPVVAAMIDHSVRRNVTVLIDDKLIEINTLSQAHTGGRLLNNLTGDLTPLTQKAYLSGTVSSNSASPMPEITVTLPAGDSINNYVLVEMKRKDDRREIQVSSGSGIGNGRSGVRTSDIRKTRIIARGSNTFQLLPLVPLRRGEYMLYVIGSTDEQRDVYAKGYDFAVLN